MKRSLRAIAELCGVPLLGTDGNYNAVSTDTRTLARGDLFVGLKGPNFDGSEFVKAAANAGAVGAVVEKFAADSTLPQVVVADAQAALSQLASSWRQQFKLPLLGVAGSNGKTTVKEMIAAILRIAGDTLATRGNLNNHIGLPLTLLRLEGSHRFAVIEMGANRAGDVADLCRTAQPAIGIVTNAGAEHLEGFGSLQGVARAEGEMFSGLVAGGVAILNADDEFAALWREMIAARTPPLRVNSFGVSASADFSARQIQTDIGADGFVTRFALIAPQGETQIELKLAGMHNVRNAVGAAAAACAAGATLEQVRVGLAGMRAVAGRLQFRVTRGGGWLIDDSYNANPSSMTAAIDVLASVSGRKWLVIGDMAELGAHAKQSHQDIGVYARRHGIDCLFATGTLAALSVKAYGAGGQWYPDVESLARALESRLAGESNADLRVLIKGSRMNRLERVVERLALPDNGRKAG